jgi:hypothetical protein
MARSCLVHTADIGLRQRMLTPDRIPDRMRTACGPHAKKPDRIRCTPAPLYPQGAVLGADRPGGMWSWRAEPVQAEQGVWRADDPVS